MSKGSSMFALVSGVVFGAAAGLVAGLVVGPKLDANTRKEFERVAGDVYTKARELIEAKIEVLKVVGASIDQEKYKTLVEEVVEKLRSTGEVTTQAALKLGKELKADWDVAEKSTKRAPVKTAKKSIKKVAKIAFKKAAK